MNRLARDIVVVGGSAGAINAVQTLLHALPATFPAAIFVAVHGSADGVRAVPSVFASSTPLSTHIAEDEQTVIPGHVYVAPADRHLVLDDGVMRLQRSPAENRFRPCIDVLFRSAASAYGKRVIGVLLSGWFGNDGAAGLWQISHHGGLTIVQDPQDAAFPGLPQGVIDTVAVHYILPVAQIGPTVIELTSSTAVGTRPPRILIVEDESVVATHLQRRLTQMGYDVIDWVPTGEAAIELAACEHPDVVLMDIHLAGALTGVNAARRIWQRLQIPIVYCTAHSDRETLASVQTTESYGYVVKPFHDAAVRAAIELALARREKELR